MQIDKLSVSGLIKLIKRNLESSFRQVFVTGEISNLTRSHTGHWYFSLKDESSLVNGALFKMDALRNPLISQLKNGQKISIQGQISVYPPRGSFQLIAKKIFLEGEGSLKAEFEKLKLKLREEGLFDLESKKMIPRFPRRIAIITSLRAAALQDFLKIIKRRMIWGEFIVIDALVQGDKAARTIIKAIDQAEQKSNFDLIVLTRGGGSLEDLWAFNDEALVRKIYKCPIPFISAIGHEVDYTLSDFVSDLRCETPSAAAEMISEAQVQIKNRLSSLKSELKNRLEITSNKVKYLKQESSPRNIIIYIKENLQLNQRKLESLSPVIIEKDLGFDYYNQRVEDLIDSTNRYMSNYLSECKQNLNRIDGFIKGANPKKVLKRGYCYLKADKVVSSAENFDSIQSNQLKLFFGDGSRDVYKKV